MSIPDEHSVYCSKCACYNIPEEDIICKSCLAKELDEFWDEIPLDENYMPQWSKGTMEDELKQRLGVEENGRN